MGERQKLTSEHRLGLARLSGLFWLKSRAQNPSPADFNFADGIIYWLWENDLVDFAPSEELKRLMNTPPPWTKP